MKARSTSAKRVDALIRLFGDQQRKGLFPGGQLAVSRGGEIIAEACVGIARGFRSAEGIPPQPVTPDTRFQAMSVSKAVVGLAIALLEDRGLIEVGAPVSRYFPEFAANGKEAITVLDVLTHRAGLLAEELVRQPALWSDWEALMAALAAARPERPRGSLAYESHAFGWICAEIVRRVSGRPLPALIDESIGDDVPGLMFQAPPGTPPAAHTYWLGSPRFMLGKIDLAAGFEAVNNDVASRRALVPGAGILVTARSIARFYELLLAGGVARSGRRIIGEETLRRYLTRQTAGFEPNTHAYLVLGRGFALGWPLPHLYGWWGSSRCYGHAGGFSCLGFADPDRRVAVAILTNGNRSLVDMVKRFAPLSTRARRL